MSDMMGVGMLWGMGFAGLLGVILVVLAIAVLTKRLFSR